MLPSYMKIKSNKPKKFKYILQKFLCENSFYSLDEYFELQKIKFTYIWYKLVFEGLAHKTDTHLGLISLTINLYVRSCLICNITAWM